MTGQVANLLKRLSLMMNIRVHAILETEESMVVSMAWRNITCIECKIV